MQLQAWRTTIPNPCDAPRAYISIASVETGGFYPLALPLDRAIEIFGEDVIGQITETPVRVELSLEIQNAD